MPLQQYIITEPHGRLGIWHITEDEAFFVRKLPLTNVEKEEIAAVSGQKRLEKLAGKLLLQQLTGWAYTLMKDDFGKPFFKDSNVHLSLSHSGDYVVGIISEQPVGIDVQYLTPKVERIAPRVMNENKFKNLDVNNPLEHLHVYWCAKEALYKAYGKRHLDFRKNILIEPFNYTLAQKGVFPNKITEGSVVTDKEVQRFDIYYKKIKNYILVYAIQKSH
ncbi:MAG: 4'-phosphopantetheinyl transferase superfamily protein [Saprospiraceae bacterium]|nr:4'-phosphopantetheinyl transferase superfamily protein [Saprospiraceae bacterium]